MAASGECERDVRSFEQDLNGGAGPYVLFVSVDYEKVHKKIGKKSGFPSFFYNKRKLGSVKKKHRGICAPVSGPIFPHQPNLKGDSYETQS